mmetsp:Transcript_108782/g.204067  ORF Transcript_108782/g.204067 Transcript_108782/m.204067 type:complete len:211 (-) Transcript_108782:118-750(-)
MLRHTGSVHPDVHDILRGHNNMRVCHCHVQGLNVQVLRVHRAANVIADDEDVLPTGVISLGHKYTVLVRGANVSDLLDVLGVLLIAHSVPKDDNMLTSLLLENCIDQCVREVAPQIIGSDVGEENVRINSKRQPQAVALPGDGSQIVPGHAQSTQVLASWRVELHHAHLAVCSCTLGLRLHARYCRHSAVGVPLEPCAPQLCVDQDRLII